MCGFVGYLGNGITSKTHVGRTTARLDRIIARPVAITRRWLLPSRSGKAKMAKAFFRRSKLAISFMGRIDVPGLTGRQE